MAYDPSKFKDPDQPAEKNSLSRFNDPDAMQQPTAQEQPAPTEGDGPGAFMTAVTGFNRGVEDVVEGVLQFGAKGLDLAGIDTQGFQDRIARQRAAGEADYAEAKQANPKSAMISRFLGTVGPGALVPGGVAGKLATRMKTGAAAGAALGASAYQNEETDSLQGRIKNTLLGGVLGGLGGPAIEGGVKGIRGVIRGIGTMSPWGGRKAASRTLIKTTPGEVFDEAAAVQKMAREEGIPLSVGEASGAPGIKATEGRTLLRPGQQKQVAEMLDTREKAMGDYFESTIEGLSTPAQKTKTKEIYSGLKDASLAPEKAQAVFKNPVIASRMESLSKAKEVGDLGALPNENLAKLDTVKQMIDDELYSGTSYLSKDKPLLGAQRVELQKARKEIVEAIEDAAPQYKEARQFSEQAIVQRKIKSEIGKIKSADDMPDVSQIYRRLFAEDTKKAAFLNAVERSGGNVKQAENMIKIAGKLEKSELPKLVRATPTKFGGLSISASPLDVVSSIVRNFAYGGYNKNGMSRLIFNPDYAEELAKIAKMPPSRAIEAVSAAMAKSTVPFLSEDPLDNPKMMEALPEGVQIEPQEIEDVRLGVEQFKAAPPKLQNYNVSPDKPEAMANYVTPEMYAQIEEMEAPDPLMEALQMSDGEFYNEYLKTDEQKVDFIKGLAETDPEAAKKAFLQLRELRGLEEELETLGGEKKGGRAPTARGTTTQAKPRSAAAQRELATAPDKRETRPGVTFAPLVIGLLGTIFGGGDFGKAFMNTYLAQVKQSQADYDKFSKEQLRLLEKDKKVKERERKAAAAEAERVAKKRETARGRRNKVAGGLLRTLI